MAESLIMMSNAPKYTDSNKDMQQEHRSCQATFSDISIPIVFNSSQNDMRRKMNRFKEQVNAT